MDLNKMNENSSIENILDYIGNFPYNFIYYYSDKPWAQPYLDEAANGAAKENPYYFLCDFSDKPWAQPYIGEAAKRLIKEDSIDFLCNFSDISWAQRYTDEAAKEIAMVNPKYFLEVWVDDFPQYINTALFALGGKK